MIENPATATVDTSWSEVVADKLINDQRLSAEERELLLVDDERFHQVMDILNANEKAFASRASRADPAVVEELIAKSRAFRAQLHGRQYEDRNGQREQTAP